MAKKRVAVIGAGSFGKNHARVYHELHKEGRVEFCGIVDSDLSRAHEHATAYGVPAFASIAELLQKSKPDAASVAVPTIHHATIARQLMEAGVDVLAAAGLVAVDHPILQQQQKKGMGHHHQKSQKRKSRAICQLLCSSQK